jgi:anti-anti-sigma factor
LYGETAVLPRQFYGNRILTNELRMAHYHVARVGPNGARMTTTPETVFHYEVEKSGNESTGAVTRIVCHGKVVSETSGQLKEVVKPLIPMGGRIVLDLTDVTYVDSSGLGTLVGLKVSAVKEGYCKLELVNLSPRVKELLRLSNLTQLFSS